MWTNMPNQDANLLDQKKRDQKKSLLSFVGNPMSG